MRNKNTLGRVKRTSRGFEKIEFKDLYGAGCSVQQSSLADHRAVWVGVNDAEPKIMASKAGAYGVSTEQTTGWVPYPIPDDVMLTTRMYLNRKQVRKLIDTLERWLAKGSLK